MIPQSWNRYAYVFGDPINLIDPAGLEACPPGEQPGPNGDGCIPDPTPPPGPTIPIPAPAPPTPQPPKGHGASTCPQGWVMGPYGTCITTQQACQNNAQRKYQASVASLPSAVIRGAEVGMTASVVMNAFMGCLIGGGLGTAGGGIATAFFGGEGAFAGAPVGCLVGGVSMTLDGLPSTLIVGGFGAILTYFVELRGAQNQLQNDLQACSQ